MLLCWLGGSPSLSPWQGELRIKELQEAAGSAPRWSREEQEGWLLGPGGLGPIVPGGDNLVAPEHQWVLPNQCSQGAEELPGLGPFGVVL